MRTIKSLLGLSCAALLSGCATMSSVNLRSADAAGEGEQPPMTPGLTYYLPRQLVKMTVKKTDPDAAKLLEAQNKAVATAAAATAARTQVEADIAAIKDKLIRLPDGTFAQELLKADLMRRETDLAAAKEAESKAKDAATKASSTLNAYRSPAPAGQGTHSVLTLELLPMAPDPQHAFRLDPRHSILRDDKHKITLTPSGLLSAADIVAADRTADILAEIAVFAGYAAGLGGGRGPASVEEGEDDDEDLAKQCVGAPDKVVAVVDLGQPDDIEQFNEDVKCLGIRISLLDDADTYLEGITNEAPAAMAGIFYRPVVDVPVRVSFCGAPSCPKGSKSWFLKDTLNVPLPQFGAISPVPHNAGFMTRTAYKNTFKDGVLITYDADRPSEALELARTPVRLVDGLFSGISKVISLRTSANTDRVSLSASELATFSALSGDAEKLRLYQKCAAEKRSADEPLLPCLDLLK